VTPRIICHDAGGRWIARAFRDDTGDPFGIECVAPTHDEAVASLTRWLDWQREHTSALDALQQAERVYHRAVADSAFTVSADQADADERRAVSLDAVDRARRHLDQVRAQKPE